MNPQVVVIGSANTDLTIPVPHLPHPGETVIGGGFQVLAGGKGANQAVAAARAGARVTFVAKIGCDSFGDSALKGLRREKIDTRYVTRSPATPSGVALIMVGRRGENLIAVAHGSNDELSPPDIEAALPAIRGAGCLVLQLEIPLATVRNATELARRHRVPVLLNPAPARRLPLKLLQHTAWLTPNQSELATLTGLPTRNQSEVAAAGRKLRMCGLENILATCGARGVCWCGAAGARWFTAPKVQAIDTVGAGDCFSGAFAAAVAEGNAVEEAIHFAIAAAAISVTRPGAQSAMPSRREILSALSKH
jgi:ribokinase